MNSWGGDDRRYFELSPMMLAALWKTCREFRTAEESAELAEKVVVNCEKIA